jgi:amino acid permease
MTRRSSLPGQNRREARPNDLDPEFESVRDAMAFTDIFDDARFDMNGSTVAGGGGGGVGTENDLYYCAPPPASPTMVGHSGSSTCGAIFNFTNCIVGAGAIGLGGAMAASGGLISIVTIIGVALMVQTSLDLVMDLSWHVADTSRRDTSAAPPMESNTTVTTEFVAREDSNERNPSTAASSSLSVSYEDLGKAAFGTTGQRLVMISKYAYAFGCLVAYTVVLHDNLGPAIRHLIYFSQGGGGVSCHSLWCVAADWLLHHDVWFTWLVSATSILPLCLLRDMSPLAGLSALSVLAMMAIVAIIIYLWYIDIGSEINPYPANSTNTSFANSIYLHGDDAYPMPVVDSTGSSSTFHERWLQVRWTGYLNNVGTFVFTFVCHHTAHLAYGSLKPELRNLSTWRIVSMTSVAIACVISLTVGVFCYMTFWEKTESDIFKIYPDSILIDLAKLLLCITMLLTFPMPFFTCRELLILLFFPSATGSRGEASETRHTLPLNDLEEPLLQYDGVEPDIAYAGDDSDERDTPRSTHNLHTETSALESTNRQESDSIDEVSRSMDLSELSTRAVEAINSLMLHPDLPGQLKLPYHVSLTCKLWFAVTALAIAAPSLGDVLALVGCASGTLIAFVLPGLFALQLQGYSHTAAIILVVGGVVGSVGTICSLTKFTKDYLASL